MSTEIADMHRTHDLKTWPEPFVALAEGRKRFEYRRDDRGYQVGDSLRLRQWVNDAVGGYYTGAEVRARVVYIARGPDFGIPDGFCVMSLSEVRVVRDDIPESSS